MGQTIVFCRLSTLICRLSTLICCAALAQTTSTFNITTRAGAYTGPGDGNAATSATLQIPYSVTLDNSGNLFIADYGNESIRRVDWGTGMISTVTNTRIAAFDLKVGGNGTLYIARDAQILKLTQDGTLTAIADATRVSGYNGDEIPAASAHITFPDCLAIDAAGTIYFSDRINQRVRTITPDGIIHTLAGTGHAGFNGDDILATSADLNNPRGVAVDASGNVFIVDSANYRVREITTDGNIHTIAGTGVGSYTGDGGPAMQATIAKPWGLQLDAAGNVYFVDSARIRMITPDGIIRTIAGNGDYIYSGDGGPAVAAGIDAQNLAIDSDGVLYIADYENGLIRMVTPDGIINTVAGSLQYSGDGGPATSAQLNMPQYLALDAAGNLFISDTFNHRVRKVDATGMITTYAGTGREVTNTHSGTALQVNIGHPTGLAVDASGNLYMADSWKCRINRITPDGRLDSIAGGSCGYGGDGQLATTAQLNSPQGLAMDQAGNLYVADAGNYRVRKIAADGTISTYAGTGSAGSGVDGVAATRSALDNPWGLAVDSAGNLYIADYGSNRVRMVDASGIITTVAGNGSAGTPTNGKPAKSQPLTEPAGVVMDAQGNLYITQVSGYVRKVDPSSILTTVAGTGVWSYTGDGGPAASATVAYPMGLVVDAQGDIIFADSHNNSIRMLLLNACPTGVSCSYFSSPSALRPRRE